MNATPIANKHRLHLVEDTRETRLAQAAALVTQALRDLREAVRGIQGLPADCKAAVGVDMSLLYRVMSHAVDPAMFFNGPIDDLWLALDEHADATARQMDEADWSALCDARDLLKDASVGWTAAQDIILGDLATRRGVSDLDSDLSRPVRRFQLV